MRQAEIKKNMMYATNEKVIVDIPQSDMTFFKFFANKMGWYFNIKQELWNKYINDSPQNIDLSDDEIMREVRAVRYGEE